MIRVRIGSDEQQLAWEEWEKRVRAGRVPNDALVQFEAVTGDEFVPAIQLEMYRSLRNDEAIAWQGHFFEGPPPVMTALLVGVQIRVWWFARIGPVHDELVSRFTNWTSPALENGELWRPLTMGLLHTDLFHLVLNMLWLAYTGWNIERALGRANLLTIYAAAVLGGSVLSMFGSPETPSLGASGGVFGLVAASTVFGLVRPELLPQRGRRLFGMAMLPYLVLMFWSGLMNEDTDNWSHFGGLLVGLILGFVLTPPPMERKKGGNRRWQQLTAATMVIILGGLYALGPRLLPLSDSDVAIQQARNVRAPVVVNDAYRPLHFDVPSGWRPGTGPAGIRGFHSRAGTRSFAAREQSESQLTTTEAMAARWVTALQESWPDARISDIEPTRIAGHDGLYRKAVIDPNGIPRGVEWWGASRGIHQLEVVWAVDLLHASRLDPLRNRLLSRVIWDLPDDLRRAQNDVAYTPHSPRARTELAMALAKAGETQQALKIHATLRAEAPADPDRWVDTLRTVALGGVPIEDQETLWVEALKVAPTSRVLIEIIGGLDDASRTNDANGLLDIAWSNRPGDRLLRRSRRSHGLSIELRDDGVPWDDAYVPATSLPREPLEIDARLTRTLTLPAAQRAGAARALETRAAIDRTCNALAARNASDAWPPLLWLRDGALPEAESDAPVALISDLEHLPSWIPEDLRACLFPEAAAILSEVPAPRR